MRETANSIAWGQVFDKYNLLQEIESKGFVDVTAQQLKVFREPRHMGKIDHEENLPAVFVKHGLSILTISNSAYRVGPFEIFQKLPEWRMPGSEVNVVSFPNELETLNHEKITSEPAMLNIAMASGLLSNFCGEDLTLTVQGRMRTGIFDFEVAKNSGGKQAISVNRAQIEIDAGYEGRQNFYVFEAKNHSARNFNLRQIYYPTRSWSNRIKKPVKPIFITHSNDVFDIYGFDFERPNELSSAVLTKHERFMLTHKAPEKPTLVKIAKESLLTNNERPQKRSVPFPQADSFQKVIDLVGILIEEPRTVEDLANHFAFDPRQSDYYFNAAKYLGLADSQSDEEAGVEVRYATEKAVNIFDLDYHDKYTALAREVFSIEPISTIYLRWTKSGERPSNEDVFKVFRDSHLSANLSESTIRRRSGTISAWAAWLKSLSD